MRRIMVGIAAAVCFTFSASGWSFAGHGQHGLNVDVDDNRPIISCDQLHFYSQDGEVARSEDHLTLPATSSTVRVEASRNGGMYVYGWDKQEFGVLNCKAALSDNRGDAQRKLQAIKMSFDSGALSVHGSDEDNDWTAYLIVNAPRSSSLSLTGLNGPISVSDLAGKLEIRNTNGPVALGGLTGEIDAEIVNGPISYSGNGGDVHLRTQNGPLSVKLVGTSWNGKGLEAESTNGPLALKLPNNYGSGVLVQTRGYSPFHCSGCESARKDFDETNKSVQFGTGSPVIHMSTVNGPVSIKGSEMD